MKSKNSTVKSWKFERNAGDGKVLIYEDIGAGWFGGLTAKMFADELDELGTIDQLNVRINSVGGDVFEGIAIFNTLRRHPAEIVVDIDGAALSIAAMVATAGDTVNIADNARMMIHDPWSIELGTAADFRKTADRLEMSKTLIAASMADQSGAEQDELERLMTEETWLNAQEAVDLGLADNVTPASQQLAAAARPYDLSRFRHPPADFPSGGPTGELAQLQEAHAASVAVRLRVLDLDRP